jgi:Competence protein J (ComJ)
MPELAFYPDLYFSYAQFLVYDQEFDTPGLRWSKNHYRQGFARRDSIASFRTFLEYGKAQVSIILGAYIPNNYSRVIAIPFQIVSGFVVVEGPEEFDSRKTGINIGYYRLIAAQSPVEGQEDVDERIVLFFEARNSPPEPSEILIADDDLDPSEPLLETAETP